MQALKVYEEKPNSLEEELSHCRHVNGTQLEFLLEILSDIGISSLNEVTVDTLIRYYRAAKRTLIFTPEKLRFYQFILEIALFDYQEFLENPLTKEPERGYPKYFRKAIAFLIASNLKSLDEVNGATRLSYEKYLSIVIAPGKISDYMKCFDRIKTDAITAAPMLRPIRYSRECLYLCYLPDKELGHKFYYTAIKKYLYWDFSREAPEMMKIQVFRYLIYELKEKKDTRVHLLMQHYLTPLWFFYDYACQKKIENILYLSAEEMLDFKQYFVARSNGQAFVAPALMTRIRKFLFVNTKPLDFKATTWYMDAFHLDPSRLNPANYVEAISFADIKLKENQEIFQHYMKYLLVLAPKFSIQNIKGYYYRIKDLMKFLDGKNLLLKDITEQDIREYLSSIKRLSDPAYNKSLWALKLFLQVTENRDGIALPHFPFSYYLKKVVMVHHDRSVPEAIVDSLLASLDSFPETLRLMFLYLYSTGLRVSEVCAIRTDGLFMENDAYWLRIYQNKMRSEKDIPIPENLFLLTQNYLESREADSIYLFPSQANPSVPYPEGSFRKQMQEYLKKAGFSEDYTFRSHDFRHTIATDLYNSGTSLQATRAFLGHKYEDMTKQYVDHLDKNLQQKQEEYLRNHEDLF